MKHGTTDIEVPHILQYFTIDMVFLMHLGVFICMIQSLQCGQSALEATQVPGARYAEMVPA